ncbi:MAG: FAD-dependent oxidoreductase [Prolixibacteraceae bacterium]|nr:FAD-dependent oxidoreductase [Prolixibacteraceae bacterium]
MDKTINKLQKTSVKLLLLALILPLWSCNKNEPDTIKADIIVYGGTSGAVIAAVEAAQSGKYVIVVSPDKHMGGLTSGGLGWTDTGSKEAIGGLARNFYQRVYNHYQNDEAWRWLRKEEYGNTGQGTRAIDGEKRTMWIFEPHVAEKVFEELIKENNIKVYRDEWLERDNGVIKNNGRISSFSTLSGKTFKGKMFIDATYEGDLMAASGVSYSVGREGTDVYGEQWNGVQTGVYHHRHHFKVLDNPVDPYKVPGDPSSGILPRISVEHPGEKGKGDHRVQAYCFRVCMTNHPENRIPFPKPEGYDPEQYELLVRIFDAGWREWFDKFDLIPNKKTDTNNHGPFSSDNIGMNYDYPEASYERRKEIIKEHETYQKGLLWFVANDPRVPEETRLEMQKWGLPKDEFTDNGNWPHQLYIREARRMKGKFIMTENELMKRRPTPESVGMGSYTIDSHNVQRYINEEGHVHNEGDIGVSLPGPYEIAYGSIIPVKEECQNLLVPVCASASHIAFGSIRMEPVFMILGQSAAAAACLSIDENIAVQDVKYDQLKNILLSKGQILNIKTDKK